MSVICAKFMSEEGERWSVDTIISADFLLQEGNTGKQNASKLQENKVNSWNKGQVDSSKRGKWGEVVSLFSSSLSLKQHSCKGSSGWANPVEWGIERQSQGEPVFWTGPHTRPALRIQSITLWCLTKSWTFTYIVTLQVQTLCCCLSLFLCYIVVQYKVLCLTVRWKDNDTV